MKAKNKFLDPLIPRKGAIVDNIQFYKKNIPLPSIVEISESGTCNRKCSFCPRSAPDFKDVKEFITNELAKKIAKELSELNYEGLVLFSGFVEPLLDKNIFNIIKIFRDLLPNARIEIVTNGDVLNVKRANKLFNSGLSKLLISIYDGKKEADEMEKMLLDGGIDKNKFIIRHRYLTEDKDFGITLSNRSGMMKNAEYKIPSLKSPLKLSCFYPHYTFFIDYKGEVLMCSHDWGKKYIVGNVKREKIIDIWLNKKYQSARDRLQKGDRAFEPCDVCDVTGTLMGKSHVQQWKKFLNK